MAYKLGFCAQCDKQIMVKNATGRVTSILPIYRQIDITFDDGHRMRAPVCKACAENPDTAKIIESLCAEGSDAFKGRENKADFIKAKMPLTVGLANAAQGKELGEK